MVITHAVYQNIAMRWCIICAPEARQDENNLFTVQRFMTVVTVSREARGAAEVNPR
jgi:hypothetical protein